MRRFLSVLSLAALWPLAVSQAQLASPNDAGVTMGHLHFNVRDMDAQKKFWTAFGGTYVRKAGNNEIFKLPGTVIVLTPMEPSGGNDGSVVNHVGFLVPSVQQAMAKWKAAGLKTEAGARPQQGFVFTPDDFRFEILEEASMTTPLAMHHIHFAVAKSSVPEIKAWYAKMFGAKPGKRGQNEADDLPGVNLSFRGDPEATTPTKGKVLDHIGFEIKDLGAFCQKMEANGVKFDRAYRAPAAPGGFGVAFLTDPWGTYIELNEGLDKL